MATTTSTTTTTCPSSSSTPKSHSNLLHHHFPVSSSSSSMKLKTLIHSLIFSHICRMARALSKAKSILAKLLKDIKFLDNLAHFNKGRRSTKHYKHKHHKVKVYGSFRLHYNWCSSSSHILPEPDVMFCPSQVMYYDSTWNSVASTGVNCKDIGGESQMGLSGYLHWLEEKPDNVDPIQNILKKVVDDPNEIDKLADVFIASCHEKFKLEKQESYRRFQEMMARSM